jgi:hypothetical protein
MNDARAVVGMDRLPWLDDEPKARAAAGVKLRELLGWVVAGALLIAGASYWFGFRSGRTLETGPIVAPGPSGPAARIKLPKPRTEAVAPSPVSGSTVERAVRHGRSAPAKRERAQRPTKREESKIPKARSVPAPAAVSPPAPVAKPGYPALWPATESKGASGRIVRIGAFGSREQAKLGWRRMTRAYPAVGRLPATVVTTRNSRGRTFYRFQIGTTSQAHSEVLCQRMQRIRFSCAVVGLPWKPKGVER